MSHHSYFKVAKNTVYLFLSTGISNACLFGSNIILANVLSTHLYGTIVLIVSISSIYALLADLGVSNGTTKLLAEALKRSSRDRVETILSASARTTILGALFFTILFLVTANPLSTLLGQKEITPYLMMSALWLIPYTFMKNSLAVYHGFQEMRYSFGVNLFREPMRLVTLMVVIFVGISVERIMIGWTIAVYLTLTFFMIYLRKFLSQRGLGLHLVSGGSEKGFMTYNLYLYLPFIGVWAMPYILNTLVGKFGSLSEVSYFTVAFSLTALPFFFLLSLSEALLPSFSELYQKGALDQKPVTWLFAYVGMMTFFLISILCFGRHFFTTFIYGSEYQAAQTYLVILSFAVFFESFKIVADPLLKGTQYARLSMLIEIVRLGMILTGGVVLIRLWGGLGASVIVLTMYFLSSFLKLYFVEKHLHIPCLRIFYFSLTWVLLLLVSLLVHIPFFLFLLLAVLLAIGERILTRQGVKVLGTFLRMREEVPGSERKDPEPFFLG